MEKITKEELISFEQEIQKLYEGGEIHSPVHFCGGNENQLIEIFKEIKEEDWVFSTHRAHYHFLLKGADREWLKNEILNNRSIHLNSQKLKIFTSAIVGGILPIALGVALTHFLLSMCRSTTLPEWGLGIMVLTALLGIIMKWGYPLDSSNPPI